MRRRVLEAFERAEREVNDQRRLELLTFALVGGGPTGVELAGTLAEIARQTLRDEFRSIDTGRARVVLIEAGDSILSTFPEDLRDSARASLHRLGVEVMERTRVTDVDAHGVVVDPGGRIAAGTVLWTAGVAASGLIATLGAPIDRAGRAIVERDLTIPGHPDVFVIGDAAAFLQEDGSLVPGVAQAAMQGGAHAARVIMNRLEGKPSRPFVYRDLGNMAIVGRNSAVADLHTVRLSGFIGWCAWLFLHIFMLIGFRNRVVVMLAWAVAYFTFQRSARLITREPSLP
jgi:NADH dehydrogenase